MGEILPPSLDDLQALAEQAFAAIPPALARHVQGVAVLIEDFPDAAVEQAMGLESPFDLLGLYHGVSLAEKSLGDVPQDLDRIFLYRRPILDYWCETGEDLAHVVRHVLIHEIGHHFGLSDADMEALEAQVRDDVRDDRAP
ncbi:MAG: metallopeptidase family protein [Alphaproteobacteria bacterium]|nr:metallopeptidase family protein [Alphaproteobacteria bacterium]MCB9928029.1 metallopeptidase family protein [Alphaproteobacteria bacterium]